MHLIKYLGSRYCCALLLAGALVSPAQVLSIGGASNGMDAPRARAVTPGAPVLGYLVNPGSSSLYSIVGKATSAQIGDAVPLSGDVKNVYLAPRQMYALIEHTSDQPLGILKLQPAMAMPTADSEIKVSRIMAHPDLVGFSPRGSAAVIYSAESNALQVVTHLPAEAAVSRTISVESMGKPDALLVTDDGLVVVAAFIGGRVMMATGENWRTLDMTQTPSAWSFVPNNHDLVVSDTEKELIAIIPDVGSKSGNLRVLSQNVQASYLAFTRAGEKLVAANSNSGQIWMIDMKTEAVTSTQASAKIENLVPLRNGFTFLFSASPKLSLFSLNSEIQQ